MLIRNSLLQILLRLGATFQARDFLSCINKLPAAGAGDAADGNLLGERGWPPCRSVAPRNCNVSVHHLLRPHASAGSALVALMQHMQKLPARSGCRNHLFVLSSSLAACVGNPKMQRVLQVGRCRSCCVEGGQTHWQHQDFPLHRLLPAQCSITGEQALT